MSDYVSGWYTDAEKALLAKAAQAAPDGLFIEIGVYRGRSAHVLNENREDRTLWLCDNLSMEGANPELWPDDFGVVPVHHYDLLPRENIALLHHDAGHDYGTVTRHIRELGPHVLPGGMICLHDFWSDTYPGVKRAWLQWADWDQWEDFGHADSLQVWRCREAQ